MPGGAYQTTPWGEWSERVFSGAGGSRTRVQARQPYAFYMLILPYLSGGDQVAGSRITPYLLLFHR